MEGEVELMVESCTALLSSMFGENNWARWNQVKQQTQYYNDFQAFLSWLLDIAESEIISADANSGNASSFSNDVLPSNRAPPFPLQSPSTMTQSFARPRKPAAKRVRKQEEADDDDCSIMDEFSGYSDDGWSKDVSGTATSHTNFEMVPSSLDVASSDACAPPNFTYLHDTKVFQCSACNVSLSDVEVVRQHVTLRHPGAALTVTCTCCHECFPSVAAYVRHHFTQQAGEEGRGFACPECARTYSTPQMLKEHRSYTHEGAEPKYGCQGCGKRFRYATHMYTHRKKCAAMVREVTSS